MAFQIKIGNWLNLQGGKKAATDTIGASDAMVIDGKKYFNLNGADMSLVLKSLDCEYTDYNLIELFKEVAELFAPVHAIADAVASGNFQLKKISNDEVVYDNKYMNKILSSPNPLQNFQQLVYEAIVYEIVTGNNYLYANVPDSFKIDYKNVNALWNLWSYMVEAITDATVKILSATEIQDIIKGYRLSDGSATIKPDRILHTQTISFEYTDKKIKGKSILLSARKPLVNLIATYIARGAIFIKGGALGAIVSKVGDNTGLQPLTPKEKKELIKDFNSDYGLMPGKSPVAITSVPIEFVKFGSTIQELEPFKETQADAAAIYGVTGVPQDLMPKPEGATFENQQQARKALYQNNAIPRGKSFVQSLTTFLNLPAAGLYLDVDYDHIEVLQENKKDKATTDLTNNETYQQQFYNGVITLNDWVTGIGYEKINNPLYEKRLYEMDDTQLQLIKEIISLNKPAQNGKATTGQQDSQNKPQQ